MLNSALLIFFNFNKFLNIFFLLSLDYFVFVRNDAIFEETEKSVNVKNFFKNYNLYFFTKNCNFNKELLTEEPETFEQYVNLIKERLKLKENLEYLTISDQEELVNIRYFKSKLSIKFEKVALR